MNPSPFEPAFIDLLTGSYTRLVGSPLVDTALTPMQVARWLYEDAPYCVLAHNTDADPLFMYANKAAQRCYEYSWEEFVGMPSRLSAPAPEREERRWLLEAVAKSGFASGYRGLRVAKSGRRFWIENVTVWNLLDATGVYRGQAATYSHWQDEIV